MSRVECLLHLCRVAPEIKRYPFHSGLVGLGAVRDRVFPNRLFSTILRSHTQAGHNKPGRKFPTKLPIKNAKVAGL
jgi:hypothetical protein